MTGASERVRPAIGVAILGFGRMGQLHAGNLDARRETFHLVGVADVTAAAAAEAGARGIEFSDDWRTLIHRPTVDAVLVCSPSPMHAEQAIEAAQAGRHVFCEKPLDTTLAGIDRMLQAADGAGVVLQTGFNRRADRNFEALRNRARHGDVGKPYLLRITSRDPAPQALEYLRGSGGIFLDMAIHDFDLARYLMGSDIVAVSATGGAIVDPEIAEIGDVDTAITTLTFANGAVGVIDNCRKATYGYDQRVELHGEKGMLAADNEVSTTVSLSDESGLHRPPLPNFFLDRYGDAYARELDAFAAAIGGAEVLASGRDGRQAVAVAFAAKRALDERRTVRLAEILEGSPS